MKKTTFAKMREYASKLNDPEAAEIIKMIDDEMTKLSTFNKMIFDRSAVKFRDWTEDMFKAYIKEKTRLFQRSKEMTDEEVENIKRINTKATENRIATLNKKKSS